MIPDKIYFPAEGLPSYIDWDGSPIRTKQVEDSDICYIRKDIVDDMLKTAEDHAFLAGSDWQKEQMMEEAVEGEVRHYATVHYVITNESQFSSRLKQFQEGDKVKIIIVKE